MTSHRLLLSISKRNLQRLPATDFLWCSPPKESSFFTTLVPVWVNAGGHNDAMSNSCGLPPWPIWLIEPHRDHAGVGSENCECACRCGIPARGTKSPER